MAGLGIPAPRQGPATIRADGIDWPLATFIDAYRLMSVDPFDQPLFGSTTASAARVTVVTAAGDLIVDRTADAIVWGDVIAYALVPGTSAAAPCKYCDDPVGEAAFEDNPLVCARCEEDGK